MEVALQLGKKIIQRSFINNARGVYRTLPNVAKGRPLHITSAVLSTGVLKEGEIPEKVARSEWLKRLTPEQFYVCREKGTEMPFTGAYANNDEPGCYTCVCCGSRLFSSSTKFDSGSGWPSFYDVITEDGAQKSNVRSRGDSSHGMARTEVLCRKCDSHLGHVFNDGPKPTGLRYCINSVALGFEEDSQG